MSQGFKQVAAANGDNRGMHFCWSWPLTLDLALTPSASSSGYTGPAKGRQAGGQGRPLAKLTGSSRLAPLKFHPIASSQGGVPFEAPVKVTVSIT